MREDTCRTDVPRNVVSLPINTDTPTWMQDIARHGALSRDHRRDAKTEAKIARLAALCRAGDAAPKTAIAAIRHLPAPVRSRMAARMRLRKMGAKTVVTPASALAEEAAFLTRLQAARRAEIDKLESRILSVEPQTDRETRTLLRFVSKLVAAGRKIEKRYLADLISECALRIGRPENTPVTALFRERTP